MKNKKYFFLILSTLVINSLFLVHSVFAADAGQSEIEFIPGVKIPNTPFGSDVVTVRTGDAIGTYIVSLYQYGAGIAGLVALFMIVLAGWKWLMAAGNGEKINQAKDTIQGAVIGLFLLFGGYLLLTQISTRLVQFDTLSLPSIETIEVDDQLCRNLNATTVDMAGCGRVLPTNNATSSITGDLIVCIDTTCTDISATAVCIKEDTLDLCPSSVPPSASRPSCNCVEVDCDQIRNCNQYPTKDSCTNNVCHAQMDKVCGLEDGGDACEDIENVACDNNMDCFFDKDKNSFSEYCCEKQESLWVDGANIDECKLIDNDVVCRPN